MFRARRAYLVGLEDYHNAEVVKEEIVRRYGDVLQLNSVNKLCFNVIDFSKCNSNNGVYRATLELSEELLQLIKTKFGNRLRIGFVGCTVYPFRQHNRCNKCQVYGHQIKDCKQATPSCANCAGDHFTRECQQKNDLKCINCHRNEQHKSSCVGHKASSTECPVYKEYLQASKNGNLNMHSP